VLPISSLINGAFGVRDVCLSVPTEVGCGGVRKQIELALTPKERMGVQNSARVLRETIDQVEARLQGGIPTAKQATASPAINSRVIPRNAWVRK
jgi:L-lactate dehydrogenase